MAVRGADAPVGHPDDQVLERDVDVAGSIDVPPGVLERVVERLGLDPRPREAIEDRAVGGVGRLEPIEEDADDRLVGDELPAAHEAVRLAPERGALRDGRPQQLAGREDRHAEPGREGRCLGPLPRPRGAQQDDHGHAKAAVTG